MSRGTGGRRTDGPGGQPVPAPVPGFPFPSPAGHGHSLRFYEKEAALIESASSFLSAGLNAGEAALIIASRGTGEALSQALASRGIDVADALGSGRLRLCEAGELRPRILGPSGRPDEDRFMQAIGGAIAQASVGRPALRAFAAMRELLPAGSDPEAAPAVERLWNQLGRTLAFSLLCAYPLDAFRGTAEAAFERICDEHGPVIPGESFPAGLSEPMRLRQVAALQRRLLDLEAERDEALRHEAGLAKSDDRFRALADSAPVLVWVAGPDGRRIYVNRPWLEFTGNEESRELERGLEGIHPDDRDACEAAYARAREGRSGFRTEFRYRRKDGAWRWLLNTGSPRLGQDGAFLGFIGTCLDVTDRKEAEERARQSRSLEAVGRLAGSLAHDFNNLLTAINGYSEISLSLAPAEGPLRDFLGEIKRAGERAAELTRQLLAYGSRQALAPIVFDLDETLDGMGRMLRRLLGKGIRLERKRQAGLGRIHADPGQVQQIILNLVLNAREAMPSGGSLIVETLDMVPAPGPDAGAKPYVLLSVRDTGPGMTPEVKSRVFDPFFSTKDAASGGTGKPTPGLGLSFVYGSVRQSGGFITVDSEPGRGTEFRVHFPWIEPDPSIDPAGGAGTEAGPSGTALVTAAEASMRRFLARALEAEGYSAAEAENGDAALGWEAPGLDVLIAQDPCGGMRAAALAERLKFRYPALRAISLPASIEAAGLPGAGGTADDAALEIPFTRADLIARLRRLAGKPA